MKNFGCLTILVLVLAILLALLVPALPVDAASNKPPIPHHNQDDKTVPANCHSKHAREAGMGCDDGADDSDPAVPPNSSENPLPKDRTEPDSTTVTTAPGLVTGLKWGCGGGARVHVMN